MVRSLFRRFVELGRVCIINYGPDYGKLCVIVDVIDHNRVLIDGPSTINGIRRQQYNLKRLSLTSFKIKIPKGARVRTVQRAWNDAQISEKWKKSAWGRKLRARVVKDNLTDFQRFTVMMAKKKRNGKLRTQVKKIYKLKRKNKKIAAKEKAKAKAKEVRPAEDRPKAPKAPKEKKIKKKLTAEEKAALKAKRTPIAQAKARKALLLKKRKKVEDFVARAHERLVKRRKARAERPKITEGAKAKTKKEKPKKTRTEKGRKPRQTKPSTETPKEAKTQA